MCANAQSVLAQKVTVKSIYVKTERYDFPLSYNSDPTSSKYNWNFLLQHVQAAFQGLFDHTKLKVSGVVLQLQPTLSAYINPNVLIVEKNVGRKF